MVVENTDTKKQNLKGEGNRPLKELTEKELKARLEYMRVARGLTKTELAKRLIMTRDTYYRRQEKPSSFNLKELLCLKDIFGVTTIEDVFNLKI